MNGVFPCVLPRRRFVLWFLGGCLLWVVACGVYRGILRSSSMVQNNTGGCNLNHGVSLIIGNDGAVALHLHSCVYLSR